VVLAPYYGLEPGRGRGHADHVTAGHLASHAANFAHLEKFPAQGKPHFIKKVFYYFLAPYFRPTFIVPVDEEFPEAIEAMRAHASQFNRSDRPPFFPSRLEATAAYYGALIGAKYGQAFYVQDALRLEDPLPLFA
jgi:LmbE family N-acetylglucosaminyl deacetylase